MEKILHQNKLLGVHVKQMENGSMPILDANEHLQLLTLKREKGFKVKPHAHKSTERVTGALQECLVVMKGKIRVVLYADGSEPVKEVEVNAGEAFVTISGGHSVTFLEDAEVFEIKNGPFVDDRIDI